MVYEQIFSMKPLELMQWLEDNFSIQVPSVIMSMSEMNTAAELLLRLTEIYSYLVSLSSYAKIRTREIKRTMSKEEYENAVDKKEVIGNYVDIIKQQYASISRAVTIRMENNQELRMNSTGAI